MGQGYAEGFIDLLLENRKGIGMEGARKIDLSMGGSRRELLRGPLYYVLSVMASTALFWRDSPVGVLILGLMCGGDGLADIVGRRLGGTARLPWNAQKSWAGSLAMFAGA